MERLILALLVSARKLRPYYQVHLIIVMIKFLLRWILHSPDASQQLMKWAINLSQYDLLYRPKTTIKAQDLAHFVSEFTSSLAEEERLVNRNKESSRAKKKSSAEHDQLKDMWQLSIDKASNHKGVGACIVITTLGKTMLEQAITLGFLASNNEAEYEALVTGLRFKRLAIYSDSQLLSIREVHDKTPKNDPIPRQSSSTF
ncbi:hypothetical protein L3X38_024772 [Prunus dulcis]|uniref:RNase H type-1 domain-containing protein n=1 Tax=Prunus dulcis TaxID=3755 RepID=A0AAD4W211_PRUDU|nr:hypothetical protein L3X38_024772 [Prunus dulcis]